ncbi:MAG TPA: hydantoinase B/oxoprolinase family protein [Candidatus Binataceae bacterium]|nr:hydantoinase B/oxoprolinase family protein [Candidatus Binataceae bacterium]
MRDPFLREIVQNALMGVAEEAGIFGARSAYSPFVNQSSEIAIALFDRDARLIAHSGSGTMHVAALHSMLPEVLKDHPPATLEDGDAIICNDHFRGGIHPTDVGVFRPIFWKGQPHFYYAGMMIVSDLGGVSTGGLPANATECFHEGIMIPPLKLYIRGQPNESIHRMIQANSRTPQRVMGDIRALVAGGGIAETRLAELVEKYGYDEVSAMIDEVLDYSERLTRQAIERMPDGVYRGSYVIEEDGIEPNKTYTVVATITIDGSRCKMDFTGTDPQARGAINSSCSQSISGAVFTLRCFLDIDVPMNEGFYRPIELVLPPGTLVNPKYPAACNVRLATVQAMVESINQALAPAFPQKAMAASGAPHVYTVSGRYPDTNQMWSMLDLQFAPMGGRADRDGVDALSHPVLGFPGYWGSIESYEWQYPVLYRRFRFEPNSAGPGKWRGGCGLVKELKFLTNAELTVRAVDRCKLPPQGAAGGKPGKGGGWILNPGRSDEEELPLKKTNIHVHEGDTLVMLVSGGGGFGDPLTRDPESVATDVRSGIVTTPAAARDYGVIIDRAGAVDAAGTQRLRGRNK